MIRFRFLFGMIAFLLLGILLCCGCSSQTETKTGSGGHARPPAGSAAAKYLERTSGGNKGPRPPGGYAK